MLAVSKHACHFVAQGSLFFLLLHCGCVVCRSLRFGSRRSCIPRPQTIVYLAAPDRCTRECPYFPKVRRSRFPAKLSCGWMLASAVLSQPVSILHPSRKGASTARPGRPSGLLLHYRQTARPSQALSKPTMTPFAVSMIQDPAQEGLNRPESETHAWRDCSSLPKIHPPGETGLNSFVVGDRQALVLEKGGTLQSAVFEARGMPEGYTAGGEVA